MKNLKQILILLAAAALFLSVGVFAQESTSKPIQAKQGVVDLDGDGICDSTGQPVGSGAGSVQGQGENRGKQNGVGNGTGNSGQGPMDGTGYGTKSDKRSGAQGGDNARIGQGTRTAAGGNAAGNRSRKGVGR